MTEWDWNCKQSKTFVAESSEQLASDLQEWMNKGRKHRVIQISHAYRPDGKVEAIVVYIDGLLDIPFLKFWK